MPTPPKQHLAPERLLTPDEVAGMFRVTARTILRWASHGQLKAVTTPGGRLRRFRASDLQAVLEADQTEPPAPDQSDGHLWDGPDQRTKACVPRPST